MRCVVTGVAGFIGSRLAESLCAAGHEVVGVDAFTGYYARPVKEANLSRLRSDDRFRMVEADLRVADLDALLAGTEVVFHQAGQPGVRLSWGEAFDDYVGHNVLATQRLLEACRRTGGVGRLVYASSSSVYGNAEAHPTPEDVVPRPFSPYGVTKLAGEHLATAYGANWGVSTVALRYFTVYGPRQRPDMAMHKFISAGLEGRPVTLYSTGQQVRDFTFVDDVVAANIAAATADIAPGSVLNVAGGSHVSVNQVLGLISELVGRPLAIDRQPAQPGDVTATSGDTTRIRESIGWTPTVSLREGLARQIAWQREVAAQQAPTVARAGPVETSVTTARQAGAGAA